MTSMFIFLPLLALALLGWLVPLIIGIVRSRRGKSGVGCIVLGGVWGFLAICLFALTCVSWLSFSRVRRASEPVEFSPATYEGALGRVETTHGGTATLTLQVGEEGKAYVRLKTTNDVTDAPAGILSILSCKIEKKDDDGNVWQASCHNPKDDSGKLVVPTNGTARLTLGPPFESLVKTRAQSDGNRSFDLKITGCRSNSFSILSTGSGRKAPGFEVVNAAGETVWTGKFAYG